MSDHGFAAKYASVRRFVCQAARTPGARGARRDHHRAGRGGAGRLRRGADGARPATGKYRRTRLFVLTLGYSRKSVRLIVFRSSSRVWAELHEQAFRRLGGAPRVVVLDNLREGVVKAGRLRPDAQPALRDVLATTAWSRCPAACGDPDRKGKVESGVGHAQKTPLQGLRFETIEEAQAYLDRWEANWADTRIHGTTKRQVAAMFAEERAVAAAAAARALSLLPVRRAHRAPRRTRRGRRRLLLRAARATSGARCPCSGTSSTCGCSIRRPAAAARAPAGRSGPLPNARRRTGPSDAADDAAAAGAARPRRASTSARSVPAIHRDKARSA